MSGDMSLQATTWRMGNFYNATINSLSSSLKRIASGNNFNKPGDGVGEYMRVDRIRRGVRFGIERG